MEEKVLTISKLKEICDKLVAEGKGDYTIVTQCGTFELCEYDGYDDERKEVYIE